jgi:hypothetical protein
VDRGPYWLRGFPDRWRLFEAEWGRDAAAGAIGPVQTPFVGRERERADLRRAVEDARVGHGSFVLVSSEAAAGPGARHLRPERGQPVLRRGDLPAPGRVGGALRRPGPVPGRPARRGPRRPLECPHGRRGAAGPAVRGHPAGAGRGRRPGPGVRAGPGRAGGRRPWRRPARRLQRGRAGPADHALQERVVQLHLHPRADPPDPARRRLDRPRGRPRLPPGPGRGGAGRAARALPAHGRRPGDGHGRLRRGRRPLRPGRRPAGTPAGRPGGGPGRPGRAGRAPGHGPAQPGPLGRGAQGDGRGAAAVRGPRAHRRPGAALRPDVLPARLGGLAGVLQLQTIHHMAWVELADGWRPASGRPRSTRPRASCGS